MVKCNIIFIIMVVCAAINCRNTNQTGYHLFKFPTTKKDPQRREIWERNSGKKNLRDNADYRLCEVHFDNNLLIRANNKVCLTPGAVPTRFSHQVVHDEQETPTCTAFPLMIYHDHHYTKKMLCQEPEASQKEVALERENNRLKQKLDYKNIKLKDMQRNLKRLTRDHEKTLQKIKGLFGEDQLERLSMKDYRGRKWKLKTIQKSLQLKYACKNRGYKHLLKVGYPLPCISVLRKRVQNITFKPGILADIFTMMAAKVPSMNEQEKYCTLLLDEMNIAQVVEYNRGADEFVGRVTLPDHFGTATHALAFMIRGLSTRYKQTVAYHFTGESTKGEVVLDILINIVHECKKIGLKVICIGSDMGSNNQAFWSLLHIGCSRFTEPLTAVQHPFLPGERLWFIPDVPHLIKNVRNLFTGGQVIKISEAMVRKYSLPCDTVGLNYVRQMYEIDISRPDGKRLCPNLAEKHFYPNHWEKMKVNLAVQLIASKKVASAIYFLVTEKLLPIEAQTTAWFIDNLDHWYYLMTDKTNGFSLHRKNKYDEAINFLKEIMVIVRSMKVTTVGPNPKSSWKPIQRGILMATNTVLQIQEYLLVVTGFIFFLPGRLTSDAIENLFSLIRQGNRKPNCLEFTYYLKMVTVSQYLDSPTTSSYNPDDTQYLINMLEGGEMKYGNKSDKPDLLQTDEERRAVSTGEMCSSDKAIFHDMCGYFVKRVITRLKCNTCEMQLKYSAPCLSEHRFTQLKEYCSDKYLLTYVKEDILKFLEQCEKVFIENEHKFQECGNIQNGLKILCQQIPGDINPDCHDLKQHLSTVFAQSRIGMYTKNKKKTKTVSAKSKLSSKMGSCGGNKN